MHKTGRSQQSVYLQRRRGKICLPEDGVPTHTDADGRILDRRRQKRQVAGVAFKNVLFRSRFAQSNIPHKLYSTLPKQHQPVDGGAPLTAAVQVVPRIFIELLRVFYAFNVKLHFIDIFKGTLFGVFILTCCHTAVHQYLLLGTSRREQETLGKCLIGLY